MEGGRAGQMVSGWGRGSVTERGRWLGWTGGEGGVAGRVIERGRR